MEFTRVMCSNDAVAGIVHPVVVRDGRRCHVCTRILWSADNEKLGSIPGSCRRMACPSIHGVALIDAMMDPM